MSTPYTRPEPGDVFNLNVDLGDVRAGRYAVLAVYRLGYVLARVTEDEGGVLRATSEHTDIETEQLERFERLGRHIDPLQA